MRGQLGIAVVIAGSMLIGGCKHQTPEQKAQANLQKQQSAEAKADAKRAAEQAKKDQAAADAQAKADKKAAAERAEQQKKQAALDAEYKKKYPYGPYPDDRLDVIGYPYILPENRQHYLDNMVEAMAASGAAYEATLYDFDFTGGALNADGRSRLGLMLKVLPSDKPGTIYVASTGAPERSSAMVAVVEQSIKEMSPTSQIAVKAGTNVAISAPAAGGLNALRKLEKQSQSVNQNSGTMNQQSLNTPTSP